MKRFLPLFLVILAISSCQEDIKFNSPGFQGLKDDVFWRANDARAYITNGTLTIEGLTAYEKVTLNTSSPNMGTYILGTINASNEASYFSNFNDIELNYATIAVPGPVSSIGLVNGGTGYSSGTSVATTGGSGSGLTLNIVANTSGVVTSATVSSRGNAYMAGDIVTVAGGNVNCKFRVTNVQNSNGEIKITEYDTVNGTVSGKFKFNASNTGAIGNPILNFQYGEFYKVPIFPSL
ncbi:MAG: hypothetical protein IM568_04895 [Flavobacterium sp.]|nr:hypothetical protein [Flavobacterium sp.]